MTAEPGGGGPAPVAPRRVDVVGSGRWARVLCSILVSSFPEVRDIAMHAGAGADALCAWIEERQLVGRVRLVDTPGDFAADPPRPVLVTNAAAQHEPVALRALAAGCPTLVEKPMALTTAGADALIAAADRQGVRLAASSVFRYASYLDAFAALVRTGKVEDLTVIWEDAAREVRYGESKRYDPSLPLAVDVMPHILAILDVVLPGRAATLRQVEVAHGGMVVEIDLDLGDAHGRIVLGRNRTRRQRRIVVSTTEGSLSLDFTDEPGTITVERHGGGQESWSGDPDWAGRPSPLTRQLAAFLSGGTDPRLSPERARDGCALGDLILPHYRAAQSRWLEAHPESGDASARQGHRYADAERAATMWPAGGIR